MDFTASTFVTILAVIGLLALIVSVVTEVTKGVPILAKIPTNVQVIVLSITLTLVAYFAYVSYSGTAVVWYYVVATLLAGFIVAYVVMYGWDKLIILYKKFRNIPPIDKTAAPISGNTTATSEDTIDTLTDKKSKTSISDFTLSVTKAIGASTTDITDTSTTDSLNTDSIVTGIIEIDTSVTDTITAAAATTDTPTSDAIVTDV